MTTRSGRLAVIGSCVTRDVWQFAGVEPRDMFFTARTSLASVMSQKPMTIPSFVDVKFDSDFQQRCVVADVTKSLMRDIETFEPDFLILDFIDERFDLLEVQGALIALSHDFQACGLGSNTWARTGRRIARDSTEATRIWADAAGQFVEWARGLKGVETVLHEAPWVSQAVTGDDIDGSELVALDAVCQICCDRIVEVPRYAALAQQYNRTFAALMPEAARVQAEPKLLVGALGHVWGATPFHYARSYYLDIAVKLRQLGVGV